MNRRTNILFILIFFLIIAGLATRQSAILALTIPFLIYLAAGIFFEPQEIQLQLTRTLSTNRVSPESPVSVTLDILNQGSAIENLVVEEIIPTGIEILKGNTTKIASMEAGEAISLTYSLRGRRGLYQLAGIQTRVQDHLGLFPKFKDIALSDRIMVVPETFTLPEIAIRPRRTRVYPGLIPARKGGPGIEFYGIREYHPGDPRRWINHRVSARQDQILFVNEFEQERAVDVGLILDCRVDTNLFHGNREMLEYNIQATATLAETFLGFGNRVGLLIYGGGRNWIHPGYGKIQRERILQALASVRMYDYVVSKELSNIPTRLFPPRSQLVLISSLLYQDLPTLISLRARGYPLLIISPDPIDFECKLIENGEITKQAARIARLEREFMLSKIRQTGARLYEWQVDQPFHLLAHAMLARNTIWHRDEVVAHA